LIEAVMPQAAPSFKKKPPNKLSTLVLSGNLQHRMGNAQ
jgi:hypothetical protein